MPYVYEGHGMDRGMNKSAYEINDTCPSYKTLPCQ